MQILSYKAYVEDSPYRAPFPGTARRLLGSLDVFLRYLESHEPQILRPLIPELLDRMRDFTLTQSPAPNPAIFVEIIKRHGFAEEHHDLLRAQHNLQRGLLGVEEQVWTSEETVDIPKDAFIRALYVPQYLQLIALIGVLGRARGIDLMKRCLDWACSQRPDDPDAPKTIEELRTRQLEGNLRGQGMDWIAAVVSEHEYRNKVTTCGIQKVLAEYGEDELMEVVACYPDFAMFRKLNANFCLTRTKTLMNGGDCCDMCYHDERYVPDFVHPSEEAFNAMSAE